MEIKEIGLYIHIPFCKHKCYYCDFVSYANKKKFFKKYVECVKKEIEKIALYERVTVQDKVKQIVDYLNTNENMVFNKMFNPKNCDNIEVVTAFLGALELSKLKQVNIEQQYLFSDINISKINDAKIQIDASKILD